MSIDDSEQEDLLSLLPSCVSWIDNELARGRGVLVHCQVRSID
jgi:dual specificity phosphatase 12